MISSYPSIYALGHRYLEQLFDGPIVIQEKVDGSQFSFGLINGQLQCRSKGQEIHVEAPEKMFAKAVETVKSIAPLLVEGWTYRAEYLQKPKHNCLAYGRAPKGNLVLFDIVMDPENYQSPRNIAAVAETLGIDCTPCFYQGPGEDITEAIPGVSFRRPIGFEKFFERESFLGGCKIEGVVVKNYYRFGIDKKILIGKFVSAEFKEKHKVSWKVQNPTQADVVQHIIAELTTEARWRKAVQHLREAGKITDTPQDIGPIIKEIVADVEREESDHVREALFKHFWSQISRGVTRGVPEWYKKEIGILTDTTNCDKVAQ